MKLSIFFPGIRPKNWLALYNSIPNATTIAESDYELVIVSPHDLPTELIGKPNVRLIKDWGNPSRCTQLGLLYSRGEYVIWVADDGILCPGLAIDRAFEVIPKHKKGVVTFKYLEGSYGKESTEQQSADTWWRLGTHPFFRASPYVPNHYFLIMTALMRRDYLMEVGGWDCGFEQLGIGCPDLSIRLQNDGAEVVMGEMFIHVTHSPGTEGDHGPVVEAHMQNDNPYFISVYNNPASANRARIDFDNWKQTEEVWSRRFTTDKQRKV